MININCCYLEASTRIKFPARGLSGQLPGEIRDLIRTVKRLISGREPLVLVPITMIVDVGWIS